MHKIVKMGLSVCAAFVMNISLVFGMDEDDRRPAEHRFSGFDALKVERIEIIERPIRLVIPDIARGYEEIYERFLKGVLIYRPQEGSNVGKIEMPIAGLANPLEGTFDLSSCGDTGQYLSIATGYRKVQTPANANKVEIWFTPRFLVDKEMPQLAQNHHMRAISGNWDAARAPIGIFWTWGGWNSNSHMSYADYLVSESTDNLASENLLKKYEKAPWERERASYVDCRRTLFSKFHISFVN